MTWDLLIRGGRVYDGSGAAPRAADIAVRDGVIAAVGAVEGAAKREIDATGTIVTPGFIDLHTHYDGQATWDPDLQPSSLHGVTTAVMGSCGVGFAPVHPEDRDALIALMEGVEDIPGTALHEGLPWTWSSFGEYMQALDSIPHTMDLLCMVPHDPLRMYVMRERAVAGQEATDADLAAMRVLVADALAAGAVGLSTGRTDNHRLDTGAFTPASEATGRELEALASAFRGFGHGVLQAVSDFDMHRGESRFAEEFALLEGMARASGGRPLSMSLLQRDPAPEQWRWILERVDAAAADGLDLRVQVAPRGIGVILGLRTTFHPLMAFPTYQRLAALALPERVAALRRPEIRRAILAEAPVSVAGDGSALPGIVDVFLAQLETIAWRIFPLGDPPDYEPAPSASLGARARQRGVTAREALYDALLEGDGAALLYFPVYNYAGMSLDVVAEMLRHPRALPGLSDGGAHVATICDASFPTWLLTHWGRDRARGRLPVERLVQMLTADVADFLALPDRGRIAPGLRADLNVIDWDRLALRAPELHHDLPAGGARLLQRAEGFVATVVAGEPTSDDGALTGARPGRVVRAGRRP